MYTDYSLVMELPKKVKPERDAALSGLYFRVSYPIGKPGTQQSKNLAWYSSACTNMGKQAGADMLFF